jgi:hypothetical protein
MELNIRELELFFNHLKLQTKNDITVNTYVVGRTTVDA